MYYDTFYIPTHMNIGNYFVGVMLGLYYHKQKTTKTAKRRSMVSLLNQNKTIDSLNSFQSSRLLEYASLPFLILAVFGTAMFQINEYQKPSLWISIVAPIVKLSWGLSFAGFILGLLFNKKRHDAKFLSSAVFRITGRISLATYIFHWFIVKLLVVNVRYPLHLSDLGSVSLNTKQFQLKIYGKLSDCI